MEDFLFMVYACEEQKKEDFINALANESDPDDPMVQDAIAYNLGIDFGTWSKWDWEYIESEVAKRWQAT
jgi:hypothetical protein